MRCLVCNAEMVLWRLSKLTPLRYRDLSTAPSYVRLATTLRGDWRMPVREHLQPHLTRVRPPPSSKWDAECLPRVLGAERLRRSSASKWLSTSARPLRDAPTALQQSRSSAADTVAPRNYHRRRRPSTWFRNSIVSGTIRAPQQTSRLNRLRHRRWNKR
jgi:hypothetical protein